MAVVNNIQSRPFVSSTAVVVDKCGPQIQSRTIIDIGCGAGQLCQRLSSLGASVVGIDPGADMIAQAQKSGSDVQFIQASGESTGLADRSFDIAIFSKSLHHVPDMAAAVNEAGRIVRREGIIIVLEPEADDPAFPVFRLIDDEKEVYQQAQHALDKAVETGVLRRRSSLFFAEKYRVESVDALIAEMQAIDASRQVSHQKKQEFSRLFDQALEHDDAGPYLESWYRCDVYTLT